MGSVHVLLDKTIGGGGIEYVYDTGYYGYVVKDLVADDILFEIEDIFGIRVRTTKRYWEKIKTDKHTELQFGFKDAIVTIHTPDEVYCSVRDPYIRLFFKTFDKQTLVVLVKYLSTHGFVVTAYQTSKIKRKGEKLWPK